MFSADLFDLDVVKDILAYKPGCQEELDSIQQPGFTGMSVGLDSVILFD